jgi:hypothetical protein
MNLNPIAYKYCEGMLKSTFGEESKDLKSSSYSLLLLFGVVAYVLKNGPGSYGKWQG